MAALCLISTMLAAKDAPHVSSVTRLSKNGVTWDHIQIMRPKFFLDHIATIPLAPASMILYTRAGPQAGLHKSVVMPRSQPGKVLL